MASFNPFARRETHSANSLNTYRVLVPLTWALVVVVGIYHSLHSPDDTKKGKKLWKQANKHNTPFSQNTTVTGAFWLVNLNNTPMPTLEMSVLWIIHKLTPIQDCSSPLPAQLCLAPLFQERCPRHGSCKRGHPLHPEQPLPHCLDPSLDPQPLLGCRDYPHRSLSQPDSHLLAPPRPASIRAPARRRWPICLDTDCAVLEWRGRCPQPQPAWPYRC